jgi:hypothetical protein
LILNDFKTTFNRVEKHEESKEFPFWYLFQVDFNDSNIEESMKLICGNLKYGWYAHFWNESIVYICFPDKFFKIPREGGKEWKSDAFKAVVEYGAQNGVEPRYFSDFWIED